MESPKALLIVTLSTRKRSCQDAWGGTDDAQRNVVRGLCCGSDPGALRRVSFEQKLQRSKGHGVLKEAQPPLEDTMSQLLLEMVEGQDVA